MSRPLYNSNLAPYDVFLFIIMKILRGVHISESCDCIWSAWHVKGNILWMNKYCLELFSILFFHYSNNEIFLSWIESLCLLVSVNTNTNITSKLIYFNCRISEYIRIFHAIDKNPRNSFPIEEKRRGNITFLPCRFVFIPSQIDLFGFDLYFPFHLRDQTVVGNRVVFQVLTVQTCIRTLDEIIGEL